MSKGRLRTEYLGNGISSYIQITINGQLAGNAFASHWSVDGQTVCWITQLVVHCDYRGRGLATGLLSEFKQGEDDVYGVMSSHPAACLAASKAFGSECTASNVVRRANIVCARLFQRCLTGSHEAKGGINHESFTSGLCTGC